MRLVAIRLSWFRGAADPVSLALNGKSMAVYGVNGSGKSSFVDAVEYVLNAGTIRHLAHEYSGKRQEKAIPNTHIPEDQGAEVSIEFTDDAPLRVEIGRDGSSSSSGGDTAAMATWDYGRTVLRQDEVASFICGTKGEKYSALLPLLGLHRLEVAAENLRKLGKAVEEESQLKELTVSVKEVAAKQADTFGTGTEAHIVQAIERLHAKYCAKNSATTEPSARCEELKTAVDLFIADSSTHLKRHVALQDAAKCDLEGKVEAVRTANAKLAGAVEPLITEKLEVLQSTKTFVDRLGDRRDVECPACGRLIAVDVFQAHVTGEQERLQELIEIFDDRKTAIGALCDSVSSLRSSLGKDDVKSWREELVRGPLADNFTHLDGMDVDGLRTSCSEADLKAIAGKLPPLIDAAALSSKDAPPDVKQLSTDRKTIEVAQVVFASKEQAASVERANALGSFVSSLEQSVREEIRLRSQAVIGELSKDVKAMWATLHPGQAIQEVHLYLPEDADKAIDIGLTFHGVEQDSPRLTLSEGFRNSLGLCIFLAMAKRSADKDRPLFLDDVVVSMDRDHRGMIVDVLEEHFSGRQVIILTHDREWFTDLRQQLDGGKWTFKALLPYQTPKVGIRWSDRAGEFDDARAQLELRPEQAETAVRRTMDVELARVAERLRVRLPYLRGDKNDKRTAHEFLERLIADGTRCFQRRNKEEYERHAEAIETCEKADRLLTTWGNRATHTGDAVRAEASKLIDACERALGSFRCASCGKHVWTAEVAGSELVECECRQLRWRHGKG